MRENLSQCLVSDSEKTLVFDLSSQYENFSLVKTASHKQHHSYLLTLTKKLKDSEIISKPPLSVVIDPGHGGVDPGAISSFILEKNLTLKVSLALKNLLEKHKVQVYLTRDDDTFYSLQERYSLTQAINPDIFLSIHADSYHREDIKGASVFIWNDQSQPDRWHKHLLSLNDDRQYLGIQYANPEKELYPLLSELVQKVSYHNADKLAQRVLNSLSLYDSLHSDQVQKGPFFVIKPSNYPSILVEIGFLSHQTSAKKLSESYQQNKVANCLFEALRDYMKDFHTDFVVQERPKKHLVIKGDSLLKISKTYRLSVENLKKINSLRSDKIYVGQELILQ